MIYKNRKSTDILLLFTIIITASITTVLILLDQSKPTYYNFLWILPFIYGLFFLIIWLHFSIIKYKVSLTIIMAIYGARMIFVPLVMFLGEYSTYGENYVFGSYMNQALALMCWEFLIVTVVILTNFRIRRKRKPLIGFNENTEVKRKELSVVSLPRKFKVLIFLVVLYLVLILIGTPGLLKESFFLTTGRTEESYEVLFSGAVSHDAFGLSFGSQLVTIAFTLFWVIQVLVPPYLLAITTSRVKSKRIRNLLYILILTATLLVSTEGRAHSIESALALMITTHYALKDKIKININLIIIIIVGVTIYGLMDKSSVSAASDTVRNEFSVMVTAYFSGPQNVATAIAAATDSMEMGFINIFSDFLQRIPYLTVIFTNIFGGSTNVIFNQYFGSRYLGQIIPSIGLGYAYFGYIFAPIIPGIAVWFSLFFEKKAQENSDIVSKNLYYLGVIMMARATATSNMLSGVTYLGNIFFAWAILYFGFSKVNKSYLEMREISEITK